MILHLMTTLSLAAPVNAEATTERSIPAIASSSERLETLVAAVTAAELVDALSGEGPFTVFAPTDEAFGRLPEGTIESLLEEPGKKTLTRILTHHVIPGRYEASDLVGMDSIETLAGTSLTLASLKGRLLVEESIVESANIGASNGVVHVIDDQLDDGRLVIVAFCALLCAELDPARRAGVEHRTARNARHRHGPSTRSRV